MCCSVAVGISESAVDEVIGTIIDLEVCACVCVCMYVHTCVCSLVQHVCMRACVVVQCGAEIIGTCFLATPT